MYGGDFFAATQSRMGPERLLEEPYDVKRLLALFEELECALMPRHDVRHWWAAQPCSRADALRAPLTAAFGEESRWLDVAELLAGRLDNDGSIHWLGDQITAIESFRVAISQAVLNVERRRGMPFSISTLLIRNLRVRFR